MKKIVLLFLATIQAMNCYSQISFEKGYYVDNSDTKIDCLIKNNDWASNPVDFKYKVSENDEVKTNTIDAVKEFAISSSSKFIRKTVKIDVSSTDINELSKDKNPIFIEKEVFLKVVLEGKANLYTYKDKNMTHYFYNVDNSTIEQLIFKSYKNANNQIAVNNRFREQLWKNLKCSTIIMDDLEKVDYKKNSLIHFFDQYNNCNNSAGINYDAKQKTDAFNLSLKVDLNSSSMTIQNELTNYTNTDFGKKTGIGFGVEAEFILPVNKNKWAILLEPSYRSFKQEKTNERTALLGFGVLKAEVNYTSIEVPLGIRYYFFLNKNSKIFLNASFVFDLSLNSTIKFIKTDNTTANELEIGNASNFSFGIGYKLYDKLSLEMRQHSSRDNLTQYTAWSSDYKTTSIVLGYTLF